MYCKNCGKEIKDSASFCRYCGGSVKETETNTMPQDNTSAVSDEDISRYKGLGGWLIIVIIGLFVSTIKLGYEFSTIGSVDYSGMEGWFLYDSITLGGLAVLALYVIFLFFKKKKEFPRFYITFLVLLLVTNLITYVALSGLGLEGDDLNPYSENLGSAFIGAIIWVSYTIKSKRVKATFVE